MARGRKKTWVECHKCGGNHYSNECTTKCYKCGGAHYANNCQGRKKAKRSKGIWDDMTVAQLKVECKKRGLKVSGRKAELVKRLNDWLVENSQVSAAPSRNNNAAAAAAPAISDSEYARMFNVKDDDVDMIDAANQAEMSQSSAPGSDKKPAAAPTQPPFSQPNSSSVYSRASAGISTTVGGNKSYGDAPTRVSPQMTEEQKKRMQQQKDEALRKRQKREEEDQKRRAARFSASFKKGSATNAGQGGMSQGSTSQEGGSCSEGDTPAKGKSLFLESNGTSGMSMSQDSVGGSFQGSRNNRVSLSPLTQTSSSSEAEAVKKQSDITEEQQKLIQQKREEALRKRKAAEMARLSACYVKKEKGTNAAQGMSQGSMRQEGESPEGGTQKTGLNPYLMKNSPIERDESKPDESFFQASAQYREEEAAKPKGLDQLPPLPDGSPPVRDATLKRLSEQQLQVVMAARPPTQTVDDASKEKANESIFSTKKKGADEQRQYHMVRVNAAAGTGKTTTLLHLATRCIDLGHKSVTYVTYSRASAKDAQDRMQSALDDDHKHYVSASTMHSCAMRLLGQEEVDEFGEVEKDKCVYSESEFQDLLRQNWGKAIEAYIQPAIKNIESLTKPEDLQKLASKKKLIFEKALYYLVKSFNNFCKKKMSLETLKNEVGRHWYPFNKKCPGCVFKETDGQATKLGFPPAIYSPESSYSFFADTAVEVWEYVVRSGYRTFDIETKKAQLKGLRIPASVLLVDECQDLDEAQVEWIQGQKEYGTHIYFVGDSAQSIYGFRGAKSANVMKLDCFDTQMTKSWRFGKDIARVANIPLFAKEKSIQTTQNLGKYRLWIPYRIEGARCEKDCDDDMLIRGVTTKSLLENRQQFKSITVIGRSNAGLMIKAIDLIGLSSLKNPGPAEDEEESSHQESNAVMDVENLLDKNLPRFHVVGQGETSGAKKFKMASREIRFLYELYTNRDEEGFHPMHLPAKEFPDFADEGGVTWPQFIDLCNVKETHQYDAAVGFVTTYKQHTVEVIDKFETHVMDEKYSEDEADIVLTTAHSAKGLEWDHVEICDDILDLNAASFNDALGKKYLHHPSFLKAVPGNNAESESVETSKGDVRNDWQFVLDKMKDGDINLLYVAMTRARKTLSIPESIKTLLQEFDHYHDRVVGYKKAGFGRKLPTATDESGIVIGGKKSQPLKKDQLWNLYHDLCAPLRKEMGISEDSKIVHTLFPECKDEDKYIEGEFEEEQAEQKVKSESQLGTVNAEDDNVADYFDV